MKAIDWIALNFYALDSMRQGMVIMLGVFVFLFVLVWVINNSKSLYTMVTDPLQGTDRLNGNAKRALVRVILSLGIGMGLLSVVPDLWVTTLTFIGVINISPVLSGLLPALIVAWTWRQFIRVPRLLLDDDGLDTPAEISTEPIITVAQAVIFFMGISAVLSTLGMNVDLALAIGSLASVGFALGSQNLAANMIGFASILSDKPFQIGDEVEVYPVGAEPINGIVESIGILATRIEQEDGVVSVPNKFFGENMVKCTEAEEDDSLDE